MRLGDALIRSVRVYVVKIWEWERRNEIERVHKRYVRVPRGEGSRIQQGTVWCRRQEDLSVMEQVEKTECNEDNISVSSRNE